MSRYNSNNGGSSNGDNDGDYDSTTLKLQKYAAVRLAPTGLTVSKHDQYGTSFIANFEDSEVLDGIVFQRDDKPGTWKVFSAGKFFHLNPEDGLVYENHDDENGYTGEMSAQDILDHPRVAGFSETFGGKDYFYTPVGAIVEEAGDIAVNDDLEVETTDENAIVVGDSSMLLNNSTWVRTLAKKLTEEGDSVIADNGDKPTARGEPDSNPKYDAHDWLATSDPTLRNELEGRSLELWITENTTEWDDGETTTYDVPNLLDTRTGEYVAIDNEIEDGDNAGEAEAATPAATDGGTATETVDDAGDTDTTESTDSPAADAGGLPEDVPDKLDDLIDYMARNSDGDTEGDEVRNFAEDEVDAPDEIDWDAAAAEVNQRA